MKVINKISDTKSEIKKLKSSGKKIGFVPTMGFLHKGHISLVERSVSENDITVVSIFVNPAQFGKGEDLESYPRDYEKDCSLLKDAGTDILFYPDASEIYPEDFCTKVTLSGLTETLCGISRPTHFEGVSTVVAKLFNITTPDNAYFGSKDYQQLQVIKKMVKDLNMDVNIVGMPIIREEDGLALSSRNVYLKDEERESALSLSKSFELVQSLLDSGEKDASVIKNKIHEYIGSFPHTDIDYAEIVHPETLSDMEKADSSFVVALAVKVGRARLIDNRLFTI